MAAGHYERRSKLTLNVKIHATPKTDGKIGSWPSSRRRSDEARAAQRWLKCFQPYPRPLSQSRIQGSKHAYYLPRNERGSSPGHGCSAARSLTDQTEGLLLDRGQECSDVGKRRLSACSSQAQVRPAPIPCRAVFVGRVALRRKWLPSGARPQGSRSLPTPCDRPAQSAAATCTRQT